MHFLRVLPLVAVLLAIVMPAHAQRDPLAMLEGVWVSVNPPGERVIILRSPSRDEVRERLTRGYEWFRRTGRDLVEELHESRRRARKREGGRRRS